MQETIDACGVDLNDAGLIAKDSLWEFQETVALVLHWNDSSSRLFAEKLVARCNRFTLPHLIGWGFFLCRQKVVSKYGGPLCP